jgi:hypothetical protein
VLATLRAEKQFFAFYANKKQNENGLLLWWGLLLTVLGAWGAAPGKPHTYAVVYVDLINKKC